MKSNEDRVCSLRVYLKTLDAYREWCVAAGDWVRHVDVCMTISEVREQIRELSA